MYTNSIHSVYYTDNSRFIEKIKRGGLDTKPNEWFHLPLQMERSGAKEKMFKPNERETKTREETKNRSEMKNAWRWISLRVEERKWLIRVQNATEGNFSNAAGENAVCNSYHWNEDRAQSLLTFIWQRKTVFPKSFF